MVNRTLDNMLSCVYGDKHQNCETTLPQVEFAYNNKVNRSIGKTSFKIVYICSLCYVSDLAIMPTWPEEEK